MEDQEEEPTLIESIIERLEGLAKANYELFRLRTIEKTADVISGFASRGVAIAVLCVAICICNIGIAFWLGDILDRVYYGFFCVAGFYALIGMILLFAYNPVKNGIANSIISKILKETDEVT